MRVKGKSTAARMPALGQHRLFGIPNSMSEAGGEADVTGPEEDVAT